MVEQFADSGLIGLDVIADAHDAKNTNYLYIYQPHLGLKKRGYYTVEKMRPLVLFYQRFMIAVSWYRILHFLPFLKNLQ